MRKIYNLFPHKPRNVRLKFPSYTSVRDNELYLKAL